MVIVTIIQHIHISTISDCHYCNRHSIVHFLVYDRRCMCFFFFFFQDPSVSIVVRSMLMLTDFLSTVDIFFLIVVFSGIVFALLAQASCLDFILFMNLVAPSVVLLAFASNFCNELLLCPKRGLFQSTNGFQSMSLQSCFSSLKSGGIGLSMTIPE